VYRKFDSARTQQADGVSSLLMTDLSKLILGILASRFKARATLEAESLVLRQPVCTENLIGVDAVMESPKLAE
jgi:hypothetical protein